MKVMANVDTPTVRGRSFLWRTYSALGAILLNAVIVLIVASFFPSHLHKRASLFPEFQPNANPSTICEAPSIVSEELTQEGKRQSNQEFTLKSTANLFPPDQFHDHQARSIALWVPFVSPMQSFFPRKLPPPSVDDPSLS